MKILRRVTLATAVLLSMGLFSTAKAQTINLLNGSDLSNWDFTLADESVDAAKVFGMKNGVLHIKGQPFGFMSTKEVFTNYQLHVEWKWPIEPSNSGVFVYVQKNGKPFPNTIECQLHSGNAGDFVVMGGADIKETNIAEGAERPNFINVKRREISSERVVGEWNSMDITCKDGAITVYVNGVLQNVGTESKHKSGHIALQSEGGDILFRDVRLTPLP